MVAEDYKKYLDLFWRAGNISMTNHLAEKSTVPKTGAVRVRRMQALAGQALRRPGIGLEHDHLGALSRMGERAEASLRPRADNSDVVTPLSGVVHRKTPGSARRL